ASCSHEQAAAVSYTLSLHDALPISLETAGYEVAAHGLNQWNGVALISRVGLSDVRTELPAVPTWPEDETGVVEARAHVGQAHARSEEHTSELQSRENLVCRLLLEKK